MIHISNLSKTYHMGKVRVEALRNVSLSIGEGEFVAIMGFSGSGKSTLLHILGLLDKPDSGSYRLMGRETAHLGEDELAALRAQTIGFVFQQFHLLPRTTALENASLPLLYTAGEGPKNRPRQLLTEVGLSGRLAHKPNELSGGQQQRVAVARSLVNRPRIILADEPTGNLDTKSSLEILALLQKLNREGITVILVTHEWSIARRARRIVHIKDGKIDSDRRLAGAKSAPAPRRGEVAAALEAAPSKPNLRQAAEYFQQAFRSLWANKMRTGLSILGILIGVWACIIVMAVGAGTKISAQKAIASLGSNVIQLQPGTRTIGGVSLGWWDPMTRLTLADYEDIGRLIPGVKRTAPEIWGKVQVTYGDKNWSTYLVGTSPTFAPMKSFVPTAGSFFTDDDMVQRNKVAVLGMTDVRQLFGDKNPVGAVIKINKISFQVIGVYPEKGATTWWDSDDMILVPVTTAMYRVLGQAFIGSVDIEAYKAEQLSGIGDSVKDLMLQRHHIPATQDKAFRIIAMSDYQNAMSAFGNVLSYSLLGVAVISLLVGGVGIMNIMLVSVTERTREIGLRKAIGAKRRDILFQFLIESTLVSLTGGLVGMVLGWAMAVIASAVFNWEMPVTAFAVLLGFAFSVGVGILAGLWPAYKASRLNPIDALRYE
jgi:macrolide transport system ATP-binding/permease protein